MVPLAQRSYGRENTAAKGKVFGGRERLGKWIKGYENLLVVVKGCENPVIPVKVAKES